MICTNLRNMYVAIVSIHRGTTSIHDMSDETVIEAYKIPMGRLGDTRKVHLCF